MKKIFFIVAITFSILQSCSSQETTYYLIRHSEKQTISDNPNLSSIGKERAKKWAEYFSTIDLDAIYSTNYKRTIETATPTAESKNLKIKFYDPKYMYDATFKEQTKGKTVLVVGHSNTTPFFANKIIEENKYAEMDENEYSNLYIVVVDEDGKVSELKKIN